jgi:hypothetical protein
METQKEVLTVKRLINDLNAFDGDSTVVMGIRHIEMTVPIGGLMQGEFESGKVVVLVVDPHQVKKAFDFAVAIDNEQKAQGMIVDGTGNVIN